MTEQLRSLSLGQLLDSRSNPSAPRYIGAAEPLAPASKIFIGLPEIFLEGDLKFFLLHLFQ
jgi:hypothetical protein